MASVRSLAASLAASVGADWRGGGFGFTTAAVAVAGAVAANPGRRGASMRGMLGRVGALPATVLAQAPLMWLARLLKHPAGKVLRGDFAKPLAALMLAMLFGRLLEVAAPELPLVTANVIADKPLARALVDFGRRALVKVLVLAAVAASGMRRCESKGRGAASDGRANNICRAACAQGDAPGGLMPAGLTLGGGAMPTRGLGFAKRLAPARGMRAELTTPSGCAAPNDLKDANVVSEVSDPGRAGVMTEAATGDVSEECNKDDRVELVLADAASRAMVAETNICGVGEPAGGDLPT